MRTKLIFILLSLFSLINAQKALTVSDAINTALKNNYDILGARDDADIAKVNNTLGNAGMLPKVAINGAGDYEKNNASQKFSDGTKSNSSNQNTTNLSAGAELSWTLFDGGKMFVTKNKLNEIEVLGEIQFKAKVMETVYSVTAAYYDVVKEKQQLNSINEIIRYNKDRVKIADVGFNSGSLIKTDLLQAKIDLNEALESAITQQYAIDTAKKTLNNLLGQNAEEAFEVLDSIPLNYTPNKSDLLQKLNTSNTSILAFQKQMDIAHLSLKENQRAYSPILNFRGGYYLSRTVNSEGSTLENQSLGPQVGGSISIPLYTAGETKRKINTARLELKSAEYDLQNVKLEVNAALQNALADFENQQSLLQIEKDNKELAKENLTISLDRLRLGQTNSLEVHIAEESYVQSCTRFINFQYNLKIAETRLKQLVAEL